jgi:hypothetical protein
MLQLTQPQQQQALKLASALSHMFVSFPRKPGKTTFYNLIKNGSASTKSDK